MRTRLAIALGAAVLSAPLLAQTDWSARVTPSAEGGYVIGNPAARTKVVEYGSYTCSHCAHFAEESKAPLGRMIRAGTTSLEVRHLIRDPMDLAAVVVARCGGPRRFARVHDAIFAGQQTWYPRGAQFIQTNIATLRASPPLKQLRAIADGAGLSAIGRAGGITDPELARCFADKAAIDRLTAASAKIPPEVKGTPAFFINGRYANAASWSGLQPLLAN